MQFSVIPKTHWRVIISCSRFTNSKFDPHRVIRCFDLSKLKRVNTDFKWKYVLPPRHYNNNVVLPKYPTASIVNILLKKSGLEQYVFCFLSCMARPNNSPKLFFSFLFFSFLFFLWGVFLKNTSSLLPGTTWPSAAALTVGLYTGLGWTSISTARPYWKSMTAK